MPASVIPITARRRGTYVVLDAALPGRAPQSIGVLVMDPDTDRLWVRMRPSYSDIAEADDCDVLEALEDDIRTRAAEMGAERYLASLEDSLSNAIRVSERRTVAVDSFTRVIDRLYAEHVGPLQVKPHVTHVPLYTLRAAAGKLG